MRKLIAYTAYAVALAAVPQAASAPANVGITANGFSPSSATIETGESVTWRNNDQSAHRVVVSGTQCNLSLQPSQSSSCRFSSPGTLSYSDPGETGSGFKGTINVTGAPARSLTISAARNVVIFGDSITLSGTVSSGEAGERVTIVTDPVGEPVRRTDVTTEQGGTWRLRVQPNQETDYAARWRASVSRTFTALVRPRVSLRKVGRGRFSVIVVAATSFDRNYVVIKRQKSRRIQRLVTVRKVFLKASPRTETTSQATFRLRVRRGFKLRAFLPASQAGPEYLASQSNFIRV